MSEQRKITFMNSSTSEIDLEELVAELRFFKELIELPISNPYPVTFILETLSNMRSDEATSTSNKDTTFGLRHFVVYPGRRKKKSDVTQTSDDRNVYYNYLFT